MKYLFLFFLAVSISYANFEVIEAVYLDSVDNKKIQFHYVPFFFDDQFYFVNYENNLNSKKSSDLFIMKDFKIQIFEGRKIISEIVEKDSTAILHNINDMVKDSKNNIWMLTSDCLLLKYDGKAFEIIKNLREYFQSDDLEGKSLAIDKNDNIYIHSTRGALSKYNGNNFIELTHDNFQLNLSPHFLQVRNLFEIDNKLYFYSMGRNISYYDIEKNKYNTLDTKPLVGTESLRIFNFFKQNNKIFFSYALDSVDLHLASFDGEKFEDLSYIVKLIPHDFKKSAGLIHIDNVGRYYFTLKDNDTVNYSRIYQIDTNLKVRLINIYNNNKTEHLRNTVSPTGVYKLNDGKIVIPDVSDKGGFYIVKEPSSVETPMNVLFVKNIYPNPAKTIVSIDFVVEPENLPNITVELYNLTGIMQSKLEYIIDYNDTYGQCTLKCNLENIPNGYYIIVIDIGKRKIAKPFIVNKE